MSELPTYMLRTISRMHDSKILNYWHRLSSLYLRIILEVFILSIYWSQKGLTLPQNFDKIILILFANAGYGHTIAKKYSLRIVKLLRSMPKTYRMNYEKVIGNLQKKDCFRMFNFSPTAITFKKSCRKWKITASCCFSFTL